jgi:hypothetical protein
VNTDMTRRQKDRNEVLPQCAYAVRPIVPEYKPPSFLASRAASETTYDGFSPSSAFHISRPYHWTISGAPLFA